MYIMVLYRFTVILQLLYIAISVVIVAIYIYLTSSFLYYRVIYTCVSNFMFRRFMEVYSSAHARLRKA